MYAQNFREKKIKLIPHDKLYTIIEKMCDSKSKRQIAFYFHTVKIKGNRLTNQIFIFYQCTEKEENVLLEQRKALQIE